MGPALLSFLDATRKAAMKLMLAIIKKDQGNVLFPQLPFQCLAFEFVFCAYVLDLSFCFIFKNNAHTL